MELNDAYKVLAISDEERAFVQEYLGFKHTRLNLVLGIEPYIVASLENEGQDTYQDAQSVLEDIDKFSKLYAVMVKSENDVPGILYRKSSEEECKFFTGTTKSFITTTPDLESLDKSSVDGNTPVVVRYTIKGPIPHLDSFDYSDENKDLGIQMLLPPFARIQKFEFESMFEGVKYFDATLTKGDASQADDLIYKKDEIEQYIRDNFEDFRSFVDYAKQNPKAVFNEAYQKANRYRLMVQKLVTIKCRERELEIGEAQKVCETEEARKVEALGAITEEEKRLSMLTGMQNRIGYLPEKVDRFCENLDKINGLIDVENEYVYRTSKLRIPFSRKINPVMIKKRIDAIKDAVRQMAARVGETEITIDMSVDKAREAVAPIQDDLRAIESLHLDITGIDYLPRIFEENIEISFKEQLDKRAFELIKRARIKKYQEDLAGIPEHPSLWAKITGRAKMQALQRENLRQKILLEKITTHEPKRTYSYLDILSDIEAEKVLLGKREETELDGLVIDILAIHNADLDAVAMEVDKKVGRTRNLPEKIDSRRLKKKKEISLLEETNEFIAGKIAQQRSLIQRRAREEKSDTVVKSEEYFLADYEMFDKVDEMLSVLEAKTVDRLRAQGIENKGLGKDTVRTDAVQEDKDSQKVAVTNEPTIRLIGD